MLLHCQSLIITCIDLPLHISMTSPSSSLPGNTPCQRPWDQSQHAGADALSSSPVPTAPLILPIPSMSRQSLMQHKCFHHMGDLLAGCESYVQAYAAFLQSGRLLSCLEDDVYRLQQHIPKDTEESRNTEVCPCFTLAMYIAHSVFPSCRSWSRQTASTMHNRHNLWKSGC